VACGAREQVDNTLVLLGACDWTSMPSGIPVAMLLIQATNELGPPR
jgi:hypothetical protein